MNLECSRILGLFVATNQQYNKHYTKKNSYPSNKVNFSFDFFTLPIRPHGCHVAPTWQDEGNYGYRVTTGRATTSSSLEVSTSGNCGATSCRSKVAHLVPTVDLLVLAVAFMDLMKLDMDVPVISLLDLRLPLQCKVSTGDYHTRTCPTTKSHLRLPHQYIQLLIMFLIHCIEAFYLVSF